MAGGGGYLYLETLHDQAGLVSCTGLAGPHSHSGVKKDESTRIICHDYSLCLVI